MYYFDNAATTPVTQDLLDTYCKVIQSYYANPSSAHLLGRKAHELLESARQQVSEILGYQAEEIFFTSSGTESNNWVFQAVLSANQERHPERNRVLISGMEHASVAKQVDFLQTKNIQVDLIPVTSQGYIDLEALKELLDDSVLMVSTMAVNNEIGTLQPISQIASILSDTTIWHVDGVQAVTSQINDIRHPRIDLLTLSGHKFHAPRGVGILAKRQRLASQPLLYGGGQEKGQRSSTENLAGIVTTAKALRLALEGQEESSQQLRHFQSQIRQAFNQAGWQLYTPVQDVSAHIICASLAPVPGEVLVNAFEAEDVLVSTTSACSSRVKTSHATLKSMGVPDQEAESAIRVSLAVTTQQRDVDYLLQTISKVTDSLKG